MASLTVWTSSLTQQLESRMADYMREYEENVGSYDSVNFSGLTEEEMICVLNEEFTKLVKLTSTDATLHVIAVVPFFEKKASDQIKLLFKACSEIEHNITLHMLGLCDGFAGLLNSTEKPLELQQTEKSSIETITKLSQGSKFPLSYTLIDDYAETGANIGFTVNTLAKYLSLIQTALTQDYYSILSPALLSAHQGDNLSMGVSSLSFDRNRAVSQLLGLGFIAALDNVGINDTEVNAQKAAHEAETFLKDIEKRYPELYESSIRPLYRDKNLSENQAAAKASGIIKEDLDQLRGDILRLLKNKEFSLPEKEAILAMILGRDNRTLHGIQYEHEGTLLDDICADPINLYVSAFNRYCVTKNWLPLRGEFESLKKKKWDKEKEKWIESPENFQALNPLPEIKRLKQQILNTTSFLREKEEELEGLNKSVKLRDDAEEVRLKWRMPEGNLRDFEYKEQPLDEKYVPSPDLKIKESVDLRKFFLPVRNQNELGSCTSFAVVSMYEAMMAINDANGIEPLSPGYLFYYSNVVAGRSEGGSNFHDQLEVLGKHGVCLDKLYEYDYQHPDKKPTKEANENAGDHRVLKAKQISIINDPDKTHAIKTNHHQIISALSEGYPVGISLKIFDNFGKNGPFIFHPEDSSEAKEEGYHAMVIAGYSEENGFYIVRNSWGTDFGDEGYAYIPTTYIDDPEYLDFACIITEITDSSGEDNRATEIPAVLANFAATETEIKMAAIRNAITMVRHELETSQKVYSDYYKYYQKLILRLTMPKVQNDIRKEAEAGLNLQLSETEGKKHELENTFVGKLKEFKTQLIKWILSFFGSACGFGIAWYYTDSVVMMILFIIAAGLGILTWLGYKWWVRMKRRELQNQLDEVAVEARLLTDTLMETQIKFHVAGMWISSFHRLSLEIGSLYDRLVSFNDTLRAWQKDYSARIMDHEESEGLMFRLLDPSEKLKTFFEDNKRVIVERIDLMGVFKDYQANVEDLENSRKKLHEEVASAILTLMADFNIVNYLLGDEYPYLSPSNLQEEIDAMIQVGQPSYRNKARNATSPVRMLISNVELSRSAEWGNAVTPFFPLRPVILQSPDPTVLILLTLHPHSKE